MNCYVVGRMPARPTSISCLAAAVALALGSCASKSSLPDGDSAVNIQASTDTTSDVHYIDIKVHQLSDGSLVYNSGLQPSMNFQDTRQALVEQVGLKASTDYLFDATAYQTLDPSSVVAVSLTVEMATLAPGQTTNVLIVIDLNPEGPGVGPADITAVTDNIPIINPPTLTGSAPTFTLHFSATDAELDGDAGPPTDPNETLTLFSSVLAGNVDISANTDPALFTEGSDFVFTFKDGQPVKILSAVVDRLNQMSFAITDIDPASGSFQTVEYGTGYALFDENIIIPAPRKVHGRVTIGDPTGPHTGEIAVAVLKHGQPPADPTSPATFSVEAIAHSDDSLAVTPANVAFWNEGAVASFNRYEEQPDMSGNIVVDLKLRVAISPPPLGTVVTATPAPSTIYDTIKFVSDGNGHFLFADEAQEQATLPRPSISDVTPPMGSPGASIMVGGAFFAGAYDMSAVTLLDYANDQRQVYLQMTDALSGQLDYAYPHASSLATDGSALTFSIPSPITAGTYDLVVCTYGRICTSAPGAVLVTSP